MGYLLVVRKSRRIVERFRAQFTLEWSFSRMRSNMVDQGPANFEFFITQRAWMSIKIVMKLLMGKQCVHGNERFAANFTRKRSFAGVYSTVFFTRLLRMETFTAYITLELSDIQMDELDMRI